MLTMMLGENEAIHLAGAHRLAAEVFGGSLILLDDCLSGDETLRGALALKPDLLLLDPELPGAGGAAFVGRLREEGFRGLIVLLCAKRDYTLLRDALNRGADAVLELPFERDAFSRVLRGLLQRVGTRDRMYEQAIREEMYAYLLPDYLLSASHYQAGQRRDAALRYLSESIGSAGFAAFALPQEPLADPGLKNMSRAEINRRVSACIAQTLPPGNTLLRIPSFDGWVVFHYTPMRCEMALMEGHVIYMLCAVLNAVRQREGVALLSGMAVSFGGLDEAPQAYARAVRNLHSNTMFDILSGMPAVRGIKIDDQAVKEYLSLSGFLSDDWERAGILFKQHLAENLSSAGDAFACAVALLLTIRARIEASMDLRDEESWSRLIEDEYPAAADTGHVSRWFVSAAARMKALRAKLGPAAAEDILFTACQYIRSSFREDISLSAVAQAADVSPSYLSALFSSRLHTRFVDYVTGVRIEVLRELLAARDYSNQELCDMLGIGSPTYLCRVVKQKTGKTVKQLRQQLLRRGASGG